MFKEKLIYMLAYYIITNFTNEKFKIDSVRYKKHKANGCYYIYINFHTSTEKKFIRYSIPSERIFKTYED